MSDWKIVQDMFVILGFFKPTNTGLNLALIRIAVIKLFRADSIRKLFSRVEKRVGKEADKIWDSAVHLLQ